jgi:DNA-binding MarR family transcriptional regulator
MELDMGNQNNINTAVDKFLESIPPAWHRTRAVIRRVAAERFTLTVEQFQVLRRIRRGIASVSAIADDSRTSRSAVSKAVDGLVNKGLIFRQQDPADRRNIPLALTAEGQRVIAAIYDETEHWLAERFARIDTAELDSLVQSMDLIRKAFTD